MASPAESTVFALDLMALVRTMLWAPTILCEARGPTIADHMSSEEESPFAAASSSVRVASGVVTVEDDE
jgi:hypothetical protein